MPFSHNGLKTTTGIYRYTAVKRFTGRYIHPVLPILNGNVHGCVFAKNRPVSLNWSDYIYIYIYISNITIIKELRRNERSE